MRLLCVYCAFIVRNLQETAKVRHFFDICKSNVHLLAQSHKKPRPIHEELGEGKYIKQNR